MRTVSAAKALAKMHQLEADEQSALFVFLRRFAHLAPEFKNVHSSMNGIYLPLPKLKDAAEAQGMVAGVWDVFCPATTPIAQRGCAGHYIEMKVGKNDLTDEQKAFQSRVGGGYRWSVCRSWVQAARAIVKFYGVDCTAILEAIR